MTFDEKRWEARYWEVLKLRGHLVDPHPRAALALAREVHEAAVAEERRLLSISDISKCAECGHSWDSHTGHTTVVGDSESTVCACCYCRGFKPPGLYDASAIRSLPLEGKET